MHRSIQFPALRTRTAGILLLCLLAWSAGLPAAAEEPALTSTEDAQPGTSFMQLLLADFKDTALAPAHWHGREWGLFSLSVAGVAAVSLADRPIRDSELHDNNHLANAIADDFEPLGSYPAFGVLGAFYLGGLLGHDERAKAVGEDGLISLLISDGVVTSALKLVAGRRRPRDTGHTYDFNPFHGGASFPSGHATQAFAVASVIAYNYDSPWIKGVAYGSAALVGFARIHHEAHWVSDVTAGGLLGTVIGRTVTAHNRARRSTHHVAVVPLAGPHRETGIGAVLTF